MEQAQHLQLRGQFRLTRVYRASDSLLVPFGNRRGMVVDRAVEREVVNSTVALWRGGSYDAQPMDRFITRNTP